ncbi:tripartite motif-containing protein 43-like [Hippopotamus amphibius kiboko]|uniref:tripartite motif-containing protein 43-like n=1 Tax=Hippopotamus amphibius kiboko TaxID=575201 RepID=UPI002596E5E2|nr:tripartite motif-containing protein 43-like [Hippopotamus amphibius kiboko]
MGSNSFRKEFTCSLCVKYFIDPVTLGCQHSFCMPCLCLCWEEGQRPPRCPVCGEISHHATLKTNIVLKTRVFLARRTGPYDLPSSAEEICEIHMKTKTFFCEVTKDVLCLPCCKSEEHVAHMHCSIEWTAEEYRQKLLKQMRSVWQKIQENKRNLNQEISKLRTWEDHVTLCRKMVRAECWKLCRLVYSEEKRYLRKLEEESDEIFQQLKESQCNIYLKGKLLRKIYAELKELCRKPDMELLQHYDIMLKRSESVQLHTPQPVVPQLSLWPIPGLIDWLDQFQVYIALDNEVVTCHVPVLEDLRRLLAGPDPPGVDNPPPRSKYFLAWGAESFTSGQRYWEVDVAGSGNWAIGFCHDSWARKDDMMLDSEGIFLLLCIQENNQCSLFTSSPLSPQYFKGPLGRVGVFLDYDGGVLSFVKVANSSLICSFLSCSFSSPLKPFLCSGHP